MLIRSQIENFWYKFVTIYVFLNFLFYKFVINNKLASVELAASNAVSRVKRAGPPINPYFDLL